MNKLLFSPEGRISSAEFIKGAVILLALNFFLWPSWFVNSILGFLALAIALFSIYCWACLFTKRLRDAGQNPAWFALIFCLYASIATIVSFFVAAMRLGVQSANNPEFLDKVEALQSIDRVNPSPEDFQQMLEFYAALGQVGIIPAAIIFLLFGGGFAFAVNGLLQTKTS